MVSTAEQAAQRLSVALRATHTCLFELELQGFTYTHVCNCREIFGLEDTQLLTLLRQIRAADPAAYHKEVARLLLHPSDYESMISAGRELQSGYATTVQLRLRHADGTFRWCKVALTPVQAPDGTLRAIGVISDIQDFRERAEKLAEEVRIDAFTGLYHKIHFEKMAEAVLRNHPDERHGLLLLDLDNFEEFNRTYGKLRGDGVLRTVAAQLRSALRPDDLIGRFGGDEFIVLMRSVPDRAAVQAMAERILSSDDNALKVTKSIGISLYPDDAGKLSDLMHLAELALHASKQAKYAQTPARPTAAPAGDLTF